MLTGLASAGKPHSLSDCTSLRRRPVHSSKAPRQHLSVYAVAMAYQPSISAAANVDLAIVGGGPGGLSLAVACKRLMPKLKIRVYERASRLKEAGAAIAIDVNGMKALQAVDPKVFSLIQARVQLPFSSPKAPAATEARLQDEQRRKLPQEKEFGLRTGLIGWYELVQSLLEALPSGTVEYGHLVTDVQQSEDAVTVSFEGQAPVQARVLVGADGYFSAVRRAVLHDAAPAFSNVVLWRARTGWRDGLGLVNVPGAVSWHGQEGCAAVLIALPGDVMVWTVSVVMDLIQEAGVQYDPLQFVRARSVDAQASYHNRMEQDTHAWKVVAHCWPQQLELEGIVADTNPTHVVEHGLFTRSGEQLKAQQGPGWGRGRVSLIGDAAHPLRPTGQGCNLALEDAAELAWHLQHGGMEAAALRQFENDRIPRVAVSATMEQARALQTLQRPIPMPMSDAEYRTHMISWAPKLSKQSKAAETGPSV